MSNSEASSTVPATTTSSSTETSTTVSNGSAPVAAVKGAAADADKKTTTTSSTNKAVESSPQKTAAETEAAAVAAVTAAAAASVHTGVPQSPGLATNQAGVGPSSAPSTPGGPGQQHTSASLYVGDLHPDITENSLYEIFQAVGPVQSIRVCRDVVTRRSLGYAYINFHNVMDAERALETMNYFSSPLTKDKPLRIMWKIRDPSVRKSGAGNIFVKSLDKSIDNKTLYDTFSQFGNILSCKVAMNDSGQSLGYGFVHFETAEAASEATNKVNGMLLAGRKVYVGKFLNKREREAAGQINKSFTNIYVKNLDDSMCDDEKLRDLFAPYGGITSVHVPLDNETGGARGFAFVNFSDPEMAARCVDEMDGKEIEGKPMTVCRAQKRQEREAELRNKYEQLRIERMQKYQGVNLYVKNLSDDIDEERLRKEFSGYGTITSCVVMRDDKNFSKGFGFVCFTQPEEATKAVTELNGRMIGLKPIYVALHQRKDVRRAQLEAQRAATMRMPNGTMPPGAMYAQPSPYMYQNPSGMVQMGGGIPHGGRGGYMNPQMMAMGRGGPGGRGAPMQSPYMAMGRGQPGMAPNMSHAMMQPYGMAASRAPRANRQRAMGPGPQGQGGVQGGRGGAGGRGRGGMSNGGAQQQFKYTMNARNAGMPNGVPQQQRQAAAASQAPSAPEGTNGAPSSGAAVYQNSVESLGATSATQPLTIEMLTSANGEQQKQMLGEKLYPQIAEQQPALAGKITGMLLEMENPDILHLLESPDALNEQVDEALKVLRNHAAAASPAAEAAQAQAV